MTAICNISYEVIPSGLDVNFEAAAQRLSSLSPAILEPAGLLLAVDTPHSLVFCLLEQQQFPIASLRPNTPHVDSRLYSICYKGHLIFDGKNRQELANSKLVTEQLLLRAYAEVLKATNQTFSFPWGMSDYYQEARSIILGLKSDAQLPAAA